MQTITEQVEEAERAIAAIDPPIRSRTLQFKFVDAVGQTWEKEYTQATLGFLPVQEFTTMMTRIINDFVSGKFGVTVGELFGGDLRQRLKMPDTADEETVNRLASENIQYIQAFLKVVEIIPDFQLDVIVLSLGVPRDERDSVKRALSEPPHRGGLSIDEGYDILLTFVEQNATEVRRFFAEKGRQFVEAIQDALELGETVDSTATEEKPSTTGLGASTPGGTPSSTSSLSTPEND